MDCVGLSENLIGLHRTELDWIGLHWTELDWVGLRWTELDWDGAARVRQEFDKSWNRVGLHWTELDWVGLNWTRLDCVGLSWTELDLVGLSCTEMDLQEFDMSSLESFSSHSWVMDFSRNWSFFCIISVSFLYHLCIIFWNELELF
jgi:hypothetical protein